MQFLNQQRATIGTDIINALSNEIEDEAEAEVYEGAKLGDDEIQKMIADFNIREYRAYCVFAPLFNDNESFRSKFKEFAIKFIYWTGHGQ